MTYRFQSDQGLQQHFNTKHDWRQHKTEESQQCAINKALTTGYPRYALPAASITDIESCAASEEISDIEDEQYASGPAVTEQAGNPSRL
jgi:hypothetical protein